MRTTTTTRYGYIAEQNRFQFIPAIFSHTGQIHDAFKGLLMEQIRHKLIAFEGQAKPSKVKSIMKYEVVVKVHLYGYR